MNARTALALVAITLVIAACDPGDDQRTDTITREDVRGAQAALDPAVVAALDSGNAAYRETDYPAALRHYQRATELDDDLAAAWFGVYMAQLALGNLDAAEQAMDRAQTLAPGASLIHPERDERR